MTQSPPSQTRFNPPQVDLFYHHKETMLSLTRVNYVHFSSNNIKVQLTGDQTFWTIINVMTRVIVTIHTYKSIENFSKQK